MILIVEDLELKQLTAQQKDLRKKIIEVIDRKIINSLMKNIMMKVWVYKFCWSGGAGDD